MMCSTAAPGSESSVARSVSHHFYFIYTWSYLIIVSNKQPLENVIKKLFLYQTDRQTGGLITSCPNHVQDFPCYARYKKKSDVIYDDYNMMLAQLTIQFNTDTQTDLRSSYIMAECCKVLLQTTLREYRAEVCPSKMALRHPNIVQKQTLSKG